MERATSKIKCIFIFMFFTAALFAKSDDFNLTLNHGKILTQVKLETLKENSLIFINEGKSQHFSVDSIMTIKHIKKSKCWLGAGIGLLGGGVIGGLVGSASEDDSESSSSDDLHFGDMSGLATFGGVVVGGFFGAAAGGVVGAMAGKDESYDLAHKSLEEKKEIIESIIEKLKK